MKSEEVLAERFDRFRTRFTAIGREVERAVIGQSPIVEQVLKRCLTKDREQRYASAADLYGDLKEARRALNLSTTTQQAAAPMRKRKPWLRAAGSRLLSVFAMA